ncbi:MAG: type II toxin-antitoxin system HicB family antitoxin [Rhodospirillales bacterium]
MLKYKGYSATVELDEEAGVLHGEVIGTRDVITFRADSVENAIQEFHASVDDYLDFCAERGEAPEKPLSGRFLVRATPELHRRVHVAAHASGMSVNAWLTKALDEDTEDYS